MDDLQQLVASLPEQYLQSNRWVCLTFCLTFSAIERGCCRGVVVAGLSMRPVSYILFC